MAGIHIVTMRLFADPETDKTRIGLYERVPPLAAIRWSQQFMDSDDDVMAVLNAQLDRELRTAVNGDLSEVNVDYVTAFTNWHSTGGMHTSGMVVVNGSAGGTDYPWEFTKGGDTATVHAVASYWTLTA